MRAGCLHSPFLSTFLSSTPPFLICLYFKPFLRLPVYLNLPLSAVGSVPGLCSAAVFAASLWAVSHFLPSVLPKVTTTSSPFTSSSPASLLPSPSSPSSFTVSCGLGWAELSVPGWACQAAHPGQRGGRGKWSGCRCGSGRPPTTEQRTPSTDWASSWPAQGPPWPHAEGTHATKHKFPLAHKHTHIHKHVHGWCKGYICRETHAYLHIDTNIHADTRTLFCSVVTQKSYTVLNRRASQWSTSHKLKNTSAVLCSNVWINYSVPSVKSDRIWLRWC